MNINLRSDTVTLPSKAMKEAMFNAELGDDVFAEDPTVKLLEEKVALLFGMEAGLFCPSGTMTNQIAIKTHTQPLDEIICDKMCHIYNHETGGWAFHSGISIRLIDGNRGRMSVAQIEEVIHPDFDWLPNTRMVAIENSVNKGGGSVYTLPEMEEISRFCRKKNLIFHLDGARIFNALTAIGKRPTDLKGIFDSISVCISKGLGAPVGSVLLGKKDFIKRARKIRKVMGGGMRQSGMLAAACIYAIDNNVTRLDDDHNRAKQLAEALTKCVWVKMVLPVETNIVVFEVGDSAVVTAEFARYNIRVQAFSPTLLRMVTHLDFSDDMLIKTLSVISKLIL